MVVKTDTIPVPNDIRIPNHFPHVSLGSEPEMCGNGIRCFAQFLKDLGADGKGIQSFVNILVYLICIVSNRSNHTPAYSRIISSENSRWTNHSCNER